MNISECYIRLVTIFNYILRILFMSGPRYFHIINIVFKEHSHFQPNSRGISSLNEFVSNLDFTLKVLLRYFAYVSFLCLLIKISSSVDHNISLIFRLFFHSHISTIVFALRVKIFKISFHFAFDYIMSS